jgi:hypothetical protein
VQGFHNTVGSHTHILRYARALQNATLNQATNNNEHFEVCLSPHPNPLPFSLGERGQVSVRSRGLRSFLVRVARVWRCKRRRS